MRPWPSKAYTIEGAWCKVLEQHVAFFDQTLQHFLAGLVLGVQGDRTNACCGSASLALSAMELASTPTRLLHLPLSLAHTILCLRRLRHTHCLHFVVFLWNPISKTGRCYPMIAAARFNCPPGSGRSIWLCLLLLSFLPFPTGESDLRFILNYF